MADLVQNNNSVRSYNDTSNVLTRIETSSQIALYPLYGGSYEKDDTIILPVSPSDLMFNEDSTNETIKLLNYGEMPVGMNRKLATWSIESFFPCRATSANNKNKKFKYWFDISNGTEDPYTYYCKQLYEWKKDQTPLVFMFETWNGYYSCQIKGFKYGRKDSVGNIYYQLDFQEYREYSQLYSQYISINSDSDTYTVQDGENILQICKKIYGSSNYYKHFMDLNNMTSTEVVVGQTYKIK